MNVVITQSKVYMKHLEKLKIFLTVKNHLLKQKKKCYGPLSEEENGAWGFKYKQGELKSAVGVLLQYYNPKMDNIPVHSLVSRYGIQKLFGWDVRGKAKFELTDMLYALEEIHDACKVHEWQYELKQVERKFFKPRRTV